MEIYLKGERIDIGVRRTGFFSKGIGLMFRTSKTDCLLFEFSKDVNRSLTSFFVFFPFLSVWLDNKNKVIDYRIVYPFELRIDCKTPFRKVVEVPINEKNKEIIDFFVGKRRKV